MGHIDYFADKSSHYVLVQRPKASKQIETKQKKRKEIVKERKKNNAAKMMIISNVQPCRQVLSIF